ncbi:MAG: sugar ABC transporter permease, partial [Clostridia bacterium]|nr:sugar ABC transporter permease [Clostridia bacterium]
MLLPFLVFFVLFVLYPSAVNLIYSFTNYNLNRADWIGLRNFFRLTQDPVFGKACLNTVIYAMTSVIALTFMGLIV